MSFIIRNKTGSAVPIADLGLTIPLGTVGTPFDLDLSTEQANDVANSVDLVNAITAAAGNLIILDPRDDTTELSVSDSIFNVQVHNDTHWGIQGGRFGTLDDPGTGVTDGDIVRWNASTGEFIACTPSSFGPIVGSQGVDGVDTTYVYNASSVLHDSQDETFYDGTNNNGTFVGGTGGTYSIADVITLSDGSEVTVDNVAAGVVTEFTVSLSGNTVVSAGTPLTQTGVVPAGGTGFSLTPQANNISTGTIQWDVDDVFLRNTGDILDSGTLTIASGAAVDFPTGSTITIAGDVTAATIVTPAGGFVNNNDLINKGYVDSIAAGIDWKESVRGSTTAGQDISGTYAAGGGTGGTGAFTNVDLTSDAIFDGVPTLVGGFQIGDRILVKDQSTPSQNGIYVVTTTGATGAIERASDQDGSPGSEVSGGNTTFVENGTTQAKTIWSVIWDGILSLNANPMNWSQTGATTDVLAGEGLNATGQSFNLDPSTLTQTLTTLDGANDYIVFEDTAGSGGTATTATRILVDDFISSQNIVTINTNGIIVNNGGTYTTVAIDHNGVGPLNGLEVTNGDGTAGNPTVGLDIQNLPVRLAVDAVNDRVPVWDSDQNANVYYSIQDISGAVAATNSYGTWNRGGNGTGGPIGPNSSADSVTLNGGVGIDISMVSAPDSVTFDFSRSGMSDTAIVSTDTFPFFDDVAATPEYRSFADLLTDLNIVNNITPNGIVVQTAADTYAGKAVAASSLEDEDGLVVNNGDGTGAGDIIVGLDILGMTDPNDIMAATDEFPLHDKSEGTAGANQKMTGQNIADGVADILNLTNLTIINIDGQPTLVIIDNTRTGNPQLSVSETAITWSEPFISNNDWIQIGNANDALSGYIVPHKARIVKITAHTADDQNISKAFDLYIDGASQSLFAFTAVNGENEYQQVTTDIQVAKDTKLRVRSTASPSGSIDDVVITLWLKWEV